MAQYRELASGTGDVTVASSPARLMGYSIGESAGTAAAATVIIRDGTAATDPIVVVIDLAADAFDWAWFGPQGINCHSGIYVDRVAGETRGSIFYQ